MARRKSSATKKPARSTKKSSLSMAQVLLLLVVIGVIYVYQEGYLDRWLAPYGWDASPTAVAENPVRPTPIVVGSDSGAPGSDGPQGALSRAARFNGSWFQVYFTRPDYPEKSSQRTGGVDAAIGADIDSARTSVQIAVFDFDLPLLTRALINAKQRGLTVQMVVDAENLSAPEVVEATGKLEDAGIPITYDERSAFMHNKIILIDDQTLWTGSMNLAMTEVYRNNNNMIRTSVAPLVANYRQRFTDLFAGRMGTQSLANTSNPLITLDNGVRIETYFSPSDGPRQHILDALGGAQTSVKMLAFSFTDDATAQQLIALHRRGVRVQLVMEARSVSGSGSEFDVVKNAGIEALPDANCYIGHNKVMIIDDRTVITGSYNFTAAAERDNDENLLIITDPELAVIYSAEFERLHAQAVNPAGCGQ